MLAVSCVIYQCSCQKKQINFLRYNSYILLDGALRLVNTTSTQLQTSGHLEIFMNGQWGTVCSDSFGSTEATVACRQLGFTGYSQYGNVGSLG